MYPLSAIRRITLLPIIGYLSFLLSLSSIGQSSTPSGKTSVNIRGIVIDSDTKGLLSHVTVALTDSQNTRPYASVFTKENGSFRITSLMGKQYRIIVTSAGYKDTILNVPLLKPFYDAGVIPLFSLLTPLEQVEISAVKPLVQHEADKLLYNVEADPESKTVNALDILRKVPLLTIDADDNILLNGNNNFRILVNGKPSLMFLQNQADIFKSFDASVIKTIEVISVPGSKYQAQGIGGIINILTYKKRLEGFNGSINVRATSPESIYAGTNAMASIGKVSLSGNASYNTGTNPTTTNRFEREDKIQHNLIVQSGTRTSRSSSTNSGVALTYDINELNVITAGYTSNTMHNENNAYQVVKLFDSLYFRTASYQRTNFNSLQPGSSDIIADYQRNFKKNDRQQLSISYKLSRYDDNMSTRFTIPVGYKSELHTTENNDKVKDEMATIDYVQPIKKHSLEMGISAVQRNSASNSSYYTLDNGTNLFIPDSSQANNFKYSEKIYSGYMSLNLKIGHWAFITGVRTEQAISDVDFISSGTSIKRNYLNVIPDISLSHQFGMNSLSLSYSQRLNRPELYYLDPYTDKSDPWNISYGNPALQPAMSHVFNVAFNLFIRKTCFTIGAFHQFSNNSIQQITRLDRDTVSRTTYDNIGDNQSSTFTFVVNTTVFRRLNLIFNNSATYVQYEGLLKGHEEKKEGFSYYMGASANLRFKHWGASINMSYNAPVIMVQRTSAGYRSSSISLNKYIFKNHRGNLALGVNNPFNDRRHTIREINDPAFHMIYDSESVIRHYNLSVNYRFSRVQGQKK